MTTSMPTRILITDFVWPSTGPEREVLAAGFGDGVEVVEAPDGLEATLAGQRCCVISPYGAGVDNIAVGVASEDVV